MPHPLDSAHERLKRADKHILDLKRKIDTFIDSLPSVDFVGENPVWSDQDRKTLQELEDVILNGSLDPQWSVIAGEIVHQLRSAFDHVAWQLSSVEYRRDFPTRIEFPVFFDDPANDPKKNKPHEYERKVKGITSQSALQRIRELQPYSRPNATSNPLWLIHDLDRIDKHRALVIVMHAVSISLEAKQWFQGMTIQYPHETSPRILAGAPLIPIDSDYRGKVSTQIAFTETGKGKPEAVIPLLQQLINFTRNAVESFSSDF